MSARDSVMIGAAGEDYVLYRLHSEGLLAAQTPRGAGWADILVFSPEMSVGSMVQVKMRTTGRDHGWHMQQKHESRVHSRLFYVFVDSEPDPPVCYVIPSAVVAQVVANAHRAWLKAPGLSGREHRDHPMRRILPDYRLPPPAPRPGWMDAYRERWDLLMSSPTA